MDNAQAGTAATTAWSAVLVVSLVLLVWQLWGALAYVSHWPALVVSPAIG